MENTGDTGTENTGIDIEQASSNIAADLFSGGEKPEVEIETEVPPEQVVATPATPEVSTRPVPKSWAKDYHDYWPKIDPKVQEYVELREKQMLDGLSQYKTESEKAKRFNEVLAPYQDVLKSQGIDEYSAVQYLMNAHYKLTNGSPEERLLAYQQLGESLGVAQSNQDPMMKALQNKISGLENVIMTGQQQAYKQTQDKTMKEVEVFASDPKHPYFDEVADDIVAMIRAGAGLEDAYEKAVWANPVTRQKEMSRVQTENETKLKEKAKQEAEAAKKASSTNVRGRDTRRTPTEPKGTMEDTMRETLRSIKERAH